MLDERLNAGQIAGDGPRTSELTSLCAFGFARDGGVAHLASNQVYVCYVIRIPSCAVSLVNTSAPGGASKNFGGRDQLIACQVLPPGPHRMRERDGGMLHGGTNVGLPSLDGVVCARKKSLVSPSSIHAYGALVLMVVREMRV